MENLIKQAQILFQNQDYKNLAVIDEQIIKQNNGHLSVEFLKVVDPVFVKATLHLKNIAKYGNEFDVLHAIYLLEKKGWQTEQFTKSVVQTKDSQKIYVIAVHSKNENNQLMAVDALIEQKDFALLSNIFFFLTSQKAKTICRTALVENSDAKNKDHILELIKTQSEEREF